MLFHMHELWSRSTVKSALYLHVDAFKVHSSCILFLSTVDGDPMFIAPVSLPTSVHSKKKWRLEEWEETSESAILGILGI